MHESANRNTGMSKQETPAEEMQMRKVRPESITVVALAAALSGGSVATAAPAGAGTWRSHPPQRPLPALPDRPLATGPAHFADPQRGRDDNPGTEAAPWRTVQHALTRLGPGDTLYLRGGTYYENVVWSTVGLLEAPITLRSYPGEQAIIDGGFREFTESPETAWEPCRDGAPGEYRSTTVYRNIADAVGRFGDSMVGLQTYWHAVDLRAENEQWLWDRDEADNALGPKPVYCGPGIWYDSQTGRIHARLAPTNIPNPEVVNYAGETDPRRLPLVIAPLRSTPLTVYQGRHLRFQDLVIRGGGYKTVDLAFGVSLEFDNCTIYCGTYGIWAKNTGPLKMANCGVYGMIMPWAFVSENGLQTYTPRYYDPHLRDSLPAYLPVPEGPTTIPWREWLRTRKDPFPPMLKRRNIARLVTHAVLVTEGGHEFDTFYYPLNHDWDISYCEFTDGHDGVYPSGHHIRFHHNWIDNMQDDGIYLSSATFGVSDNVHVYRNLITRTGSAFAGHTRGGPDGRIYVYRNVVDLRNGVNRNRPTADAPAGRVAALNVFLAHGGKLHGMESIAWYQNTIVAPARAYSFAHYLLFRTTEETVRRCFNNLFVYLNDWPAPATALKTLGTTAHSILVDGNLHWCPDSDKPVPADFLGLAQTCEASARMKQEYPPGWCANGVVADPQFAAFSAAPTAANDYRLAPDSPAVAAGILLPADLDDPLRPAAGARPDIGAVPLGAEPLRVGRNARVMAGPPSLPLGLDAGKTDTEGTQ